MKTGQIGALKNIVYVIFIFESITIYFIPCFFESEAPPKAYFALRKSGVVIFR
jgi:hypothetical protein